MDDCIFCKIASGTIPSEKVFEDDATLAFRDIQPQAPVHILIIPKRHVRDAMDLALQSGLMARMLEAAAEVARREGVDQSGFRLAMNCGPDGRQTVGHAHMHLLGGRALSEVMA